MNYYKIYNDEKRPGKYNMTSFKIGFSKNVDSSSPHVDNGFKNVLWKQITIGDCIAEKKSFKFDNC